jgi:hypothetical protein
MARFSSSETWRASRTWKSQDAEILVLLGPAVLVPGRAERGEPRGPELDGRRGGEELGVLRVGRRPSRLDVVHAELVEAPGDGDLIVEGEGDALALGAVAERGVEELDVSHATRLPRTGP